MKNIHSLSSPTNFDHRDVGAENAGEISGRLPGIPGKPGVSGILRNYWSRQTGSRCDLSNVRGHLCLVGTALVTQAYIMCPSLWNGSSTHNHCESEARVTSIVPVPRENGIWFVANIVMDISSESLSFLEPRPFFKIPQLR